jgi:hypothetical protein
MDRIFNILYKINLLKKNLWATSTHGIRPEKLAAVYPKVTLAISFKLSWRESNIL